MRARRVVVMVVCSVVISVLARPALAQTVGSWEVFGGYSYVEDTPDATNLPLGWVVGTARTLTGFVSLVGELCGNYKTLSATGSDVRLSVHTFMGGGRASAKIGKLTEFGQVLAGVVRGRATIFDVTTSTTNLGLQGGAGLDYPLTSRLAGRAQLDYRYIFIVRGQGADNTHDFRLVAAIVYHGWRR